MELRSVIWVGLVFQFPYEEHIVRWKKEWIWLNGNKILQSIFITWLPFPFPAGEVERQGLV